MSETRRLNVVLTGDSKGAQAAITTVQKQAAGLNQGTDQANTKMGKLAKTQQLAAKAAIPAAAAVGGLGLALFKSAQAASEMDDTLSATKVVFGSAATAVIDFSTKAAKAFGLSKQAALDAAGTFGTLGKAAGLQGPALSKFSNTLVGLAGDVASFKGGTPEEAVQAFGAALRGETEPIRRYGVMIDEARLQQQAMDMGLVKVEKNLDKLAAAKLRAQVAVQKYSEAVKKHGKGSKEAMAAEAAMASASDAVNRAMKGTLPKLTAAQKTQAAYGLILKDTKDAQGDFARTSESAKNQQSRLKAELANASVTLGTKFLPVLAKGAKMLAGFAEWAGKNTGVVTAVAGVIAGLATVIMAVSVASRIATAATTIWSGITKAAAAAQWLLNVALSMNPIGLVVIAIIALIAVIVLLWKKNETFRKVVLAVWGAIKAAVMGVVSWFKSFVLPAIAAYYTFIFNVFMKVKAFLVFVFNAYRAIFLAVMNWIITRWKATWNNVRAIVQAVVNGVRALINGMRTAVSSVFNSIVSKIMSIRNSIVGFFSGAGSWLFNAGKNIIQGLINGVTGMIGSLKDRFNSVTNMIPDWKGPESVDKVLLKPAGQMLIKGLITGIDMETPAVKSTLLALTGSIAATTEGGLAGGNAGLAVAGATAQAGMIVNVTVMGHVTTEDKLADSVALKVRDRIARNGSRNGSTGV